MNMILSGYATLIGAVIFCIAAGALMLGMPSGDAFSLGVQLTAWLIALPVAASLAIREVRLRW
jgi:hypothetical protein